MELEVEQRFDKWLRLFANFTYNNAKVKENPAKVETGKNMVWKADEVLTEGS